MPIFDLIKSIKMRLFTEEEGKSDIQTQMENIYVSRNIDVEPIIHQAYNLTMEDETPPHFRGRGYYANHMSWNLVGLMRELYGDYMFMDEENRPYLFIDKHIRVYFKKLNSRYAPDNIPTAHVRDMNTNQLELNDVRITALYAGFRIRENMFWDEIEGCYLVQMGALKEPKWISDLSFLGGQMNGSPNVPNLPVNPIVVPDEIRVIGKDKTTKREAN